MGYLVVKLLHDANWSESGKKLAPGRWAQVRCGLYGRVGSLDKSRHFAFAYADKRFGCVPED